MRARLTTVMGLLRFGWEKESPLAPTVCGGGVLAHMETWNPPDGVHLLWSVDARAHESLNDADRWRADQYGVVIGVDVNHLGVAGLGGEPFGISP